MDRLRSHGLAFVLLGGLVAAHLKAARRRNNGLALTLGLFRGFINGASMASSGSGKIARLRNGFCCDRSRRSRGGCFHMAGR
jgi:hypothetical protein